MLITSFLSFYKALVFPILVQFILNHNWYNEEMSTFISDIRGF
jgi:hypothetical protein